MPPSDDASAGPARPHRPRAAARRVRDRAPARARLPRACRRGATSSARSRCSAASGSASGCSFTQVLAPPARDRGRRPVVDALDVDRREQPAPDRLQRPRRQPHRRDARRRDRRVRARPPLLDELHARRDPLPPVLRVPVAVHVLDARARDHEQSPHPVHVLGAGGRLLVLPDRLLHREEVRRRRLEEGVHHEPRRRRLLHARDHDRLRGPLEDA